MMAASASRFDIARFGAEVFRASPRQSDLMIVAGTVNYKMASRIRRLYDMMPEPKYVIAMGACGAAGGVFKGLYHVVDGVENVIPVDVFIAGCPPRPDEIIDGVVACLGLLKGDLAHGGKEWRQKKPLEVPRVEAKAPEAIA
jgi:NADH-quinone oxidoreductase subunit B